MTLEGTGPFSVFPTRDVGGAAQTSESWWRENHDRVCGSAWKEPVLVPQADPGPEKGHYGGMVSCQEFITWGHGEPHLDPVPSCPSQLFSPHSRDLLPATYKMTQTQTGGAVRSSEQ